MPEGGTILPLEARGLAYEAGGRWLVDDIDLVIHPRSATAVMGPNGAGKSLLLRLLHGLLQPSAGAVTWAGRPADAAIRRRQAMVFQKPILLRRSTAANLDYALRLTGLSAARRRQRRAALLELGQLAHLAQTPARLLSGGEQQRLALVRALALEPEILFLDEPTASLDPAATLAIEALIAEAHAAGAAIVLVTHDRAQAQRLTRRVVLLWHGRIVEDEDAASFFTSPRTALARAFLSGQVMV